MILRTRTLNHSDTVQLRPLLLGLDPSFSPRLQLAYLDSPHPIGASAPSRLPCVPCAAAACQHAASRAPAACSQPAAAA